MTLLHLLKCKLHSVTVTDSNLEYEGSVAIDKDFLEKSGLIANERVEIYNITNGERFATYVIEAEKGSKTIGIQGAAAHKAKKGDKVIICSYFLIKESRAKKHKPLKVFFDNKNNITRVEK
jgi:aspartate 1-decarboxylase